MFSSETRLRIGYYYDDKYLKPVPAVQRSVEMISCALERSGHTLVPFEVPDVSKVMRFYTISTYREIQTNFSFAKTKFVKNLIACQSRITCLISSSCERHSARSSLVFVTRSACIRWFKGCKQDVEACNKWWDPP